MITPCLCDRACSSRRIQNNSFILSESAKRLTTKCCTQPKITNQKLKLRFVKNDSPFSRQHLASPQQRLPHHRPDRAAPVRQNDPGKGGFCRQGVCVS